MLYLFWALLNTAAYIYFIYLLIISGKLVRQKLGTLAACVFVLGLFSFMGVTHDSDNNVKPGTNEVKKWEFQSSDSLDKNTHASNWISIQNNTINNYNLFYTHAYTKGTTRHVPISASTSTSGWSIGTRWKSIYIDMEQTDNNEQFKYTVYGSVQWYILGINVYSQLKPIRV
jgi:hypothetical protein